MLDENFPTYRLKPSSDNPLHTLLYFTHNGSDPSPEYLIKRPPASASKHQYALALFDIHCQSIIYGEILVRPDWAQPTLSAAELRAQNGAAPPVMPLMPEAFSIMLYNPDISIAVKRHRPGSWNKDSWTFEIPERTFRLPSASQIDQESGGSENQVSELTPKVVFQWKRDGRLSKDLTCYMCGRSVGDKKSKEPDITVAMYRGGKNEDMVSIYEPNMARVEVEDRKGLEVVLLLSAEVIRDLYLSPRQDPFNFTSTTPPAMANGRNAGAKPQSDHALVSGALGGVPSPPPGQQRPLPSSSGPSQNRDAARQAEIDAETQRLKAMVAEEERQTRDRLAREEEEITRKMLQREEDELRQQKQAEIDRETERLRREYGVQAPSIQPQDGPSPALPPRPNQQQQQQHQPIAGTLNSGTWYGPAGGTRLQPGMPPRPNSVGPPPRPAFNNNNNYYSSNNNNAGPSWQQPPPLQQNTQPGGQQQPQQNNNKKHSNPLGAFMHGGPYAGSGGAAAAAASVSNLFSSSTRTEEDKRKKAKKKRSVHF